jgi:hypothetical protein
VSLVLYDRREWIKADLPDVRESNPGDRQSTAEAGTAEHRDRRTYLQTLGTIYAVLLAFVI